MAEPIDRAALFRTLGDPGRLRILALLARQELSVSELQEVLGLGQSTVSGHLAQLRRVGLVAARREGAASYSCLAEPPGEGALLAIVRDTPLTTADEAALARVLAARGDPAPDGLGPDYLPGRSWEALAHLLLALLPPLRIADLGVGTGHLTRLLAARSSVVAVDQDPAALARVVHPNIEPRRGTLEDPPLKAGEFDLVLLSQSLHCAVDPVETLRRCRTALVPGGRIAVLDLAPHTHTWVGPRLGHRHLGFADLDGLLASAGFTEVSVTTVHVDRRSPAFTTLLGVGRR